MTEHGRLILRETLVSMVINMAFSAAFMVLVFGGRSVIDLWGAKGLAVDFVPQTFMVALMGALVPGLLARRGVAAGRIAPLARLRRPLPANLILRSLLLALAATIMLGGLAVAVLTTFWPGPLSFDAVFLPKILYGASVAACVTPLAVRAALGDRKDAG